MLPLRKEDGFFTVTYPYPDIIHRTKSPMLDAVRNPAMNRAMLGSGFILCLNYPKCAF